MPYLTLGDYTPRQDEETIENPDPSRRYQRCNSDVQDGLEESITSRTSRQIKHEPITLDQYYYPIIFNTDERDKDQVLSKYLERQHDKRDREKSTDGSTEQRNKKNAMAANGDTNISHEADEQTKKKILMVDQLWLWIIDEGANMDCRMICNRTN